MELYMTGKSKRPKSNVIFGDFERILDDPFLSDGEKQFLLGFDELNNSERETLKNAFKIMNKARCEPQKLDHSKDVPVTLEDSVDEILRSMSDEEKRILGASSYDDLYSFHFGLGAHIRNLFFLWDEENPLLLDIGEGEQIHPDDASHEIIKGLWKMINGKPIRRPDFKLIE